MLEDNDMAVARYTHLVNRSINVTVSRKQILFLVSYSERVQNFAQKYLHKE